MTIKVVLPRVGGAFAVRSGRSTDMIIARLAVMRNRSTQLLQEIGQLEERFRLHAEGHPYASPLGLPIPPAG